MNRVRSKIDYSDERSGGLVFQIDSPEDDNLLQGKTRVVDVERDISLKFMNSTGREPGGAFVLTHGDMRIPFHTKQTSGLVDEETGAPYFISEIVSFGSSLYLKGDRDVPAYNFTSHDEGVKWRRVAAEALLIYGVRYDGPSLDPAYTRVLLEGELLTRRDFGYKN